MKRNLHIGHQEVKKLLERQIASNRLAHAYLFIGPENVGKVNLAKDFAGNLQGLTGGQERIENNEFPDVIFIEPKIAKKTFKKSIGIKEVHKVQQMLSLTAHSKKFKIAIVSDAEYMTEEAQNAFLKTLEEPTKKSILILTSANEERILSTIRSRCQKVYFGLVPKKEIVSYLEKIIPDKKKAESIASFSGGRPGKALNLMADENYRNYLADLAILEKIDKENIAQRFERAKGLSERDDLINVLNNWLIYFRDLSVLKLGINDKLINAWLKDELVSFYEEKQVEEINEVVRRIKKTINALGQNANPRLALENLLLQI